MDSIYCKLQFTASMNCSKHNSMDGDYYRWESIWTSLLLRRVFFFFFCENQKKVQTVNLTKSFEGSFIHLKY